MPKSRKNFVGPQLRQLRRTHEQTQAEMARALGLSPAYINLLENNQRSLSVQDMNMRPVSVRNTRFRPVNNGLVNSPKSGARMSCIGAFIAWRTSSGMLVGPGMNRWVWPVVMVDPLCPVGAVTENAGRSRPG